MLEKRTAREPGYGGVAKALHWLILALLAMQFVIAWTMPAVRRGTQPETLINLHLSMGMLILAIVILRLLWRAGHPVPLDSDAIPLWQHRAAEATHALLYLLLLVLPLMGWVNAASRGWGIDLFGLVTLPPILPTASPLLRQFGQLHTITSYVLLGLVGLHVAAALYHHLWLRDRTLSRMLPQLD